MAKLTEVQIYETILIHISWDEVELKEKILKFVGPAREERAIHETLVSNIKDCKKLIRLLNFIKKKIKKII